MEGRSTVDGDHTRLGALRAGCSSNSGTANWKRLSAGSVSGIAGISEDLGPLAMLEASRLDAATVLELATGQARGETHRDEFGERELFLQGSTACRFGVVLDLAHSQARSAYASDADAIRLGEFFRGAMAEAPATHRVGYLGLVGALDPRSWDAELASWLPVELRSRLAGSRSDGKAEIQDAARRCRIRLRQSENCGTVSEWVRSDLEWFDEVPIPEMTGGELEGQTEQVRGAARRFAESLPAGYALRRDAAYRLQRVVREELVRAIEPVLNAEAQDRPHSTYAEKKSLARWLNGELRRLGLALRDPSGHRCFLLGSTGGPGGNGRFVFEYTDERGVRRHPVSSAVLPHLELMPDDLYRGPHPSRPSRDR